MRVLIAGWHGQIARALAEVGFARADVSALSFGQPALDLCKPASIRATLVEAEPDVMINTAAYTAVDQAESEPEAAFELNRTGAAVFAEVAAREGIPVIHLSTDYVFDGAKAGPYTEDDAPAPRTVYGRSKLEGEQAVAAANPMHIVLRTGWLYSPYGRNFVRTMLARARERAEVDVVQDQVGSPTYATHLAGAILDVAGRVVAECDTAPWGLYHMASAGEVSWYAFARRVFEVSRALGGPCAEVRPIASADYATTAPRLANACLDGSKLARAFGVRLPDWPDGLEDCVRRLLAEDGA